MENKADFPKLFSKLNFQGADNMLTNYFYTLLLLLLFCPCRHAKAQVAIHNVRANIAFGSKFYSIFLNDAGESFVVKGTGKVKQDSLRVVTSDTSQRFKIDSVKIFFETINKIRAHPIFDSIRYDEPRLQIYLGAERIYDTYKTDETFWDLFRLIMTQIPKGYSPFRPSDQPF